jgi:hypothetical protein
MMNEYVRMVTCYDTAAKSIHMIHVIDFLQTLVTRLGMLNDISDLHSVEFVFVESLCANFLSSLHSVYIDSP